MIGLAIRWGDRETTRSTNAFSFRCSLIESKGNLRATGRSEEEGGEGRGGGRCTRAAIVRLVTREACTRYFWEVNGPDYEVQVLRSVTVPVIPWVVDVTFVLLKISSSTFFPYFSIRPGEVDACLLRNFLSEWTLLFRFIQLPLTNFDRNWISSRSFYPSSNII